MTRERKIVYGGLFLLIYLVTVWLPPWYRQKALANHNPGHVVAFTNPFTGMKWAVMSTGGGVFEFNRLTALRTHVVKWQIDGPTRQQIVWRDLGNGVVTSQAYDPEGQPVTLPTPPPNLD